MNLHVDGKIYLKLKARKAYADGNSTLKSLRIERQNKIDSFLEELAIEYNEPKRVCWFSRKKYKPEVPWDKKSVLEFLQNEYKKHEDCSLSFWRVLFGFESGHLENALLYSEYLVKKRAYSAEINAMNKLIRSARMALQEDDDAVLYVSSEVNEVIEKYKGDY